MSRQESHIEINEAEFQLGQVDVNPSKVVNIVVLLLDICAIIVYIDLWYVNARQRHLFTFVFEWKLVAQEQIKPYATAYRNSLKRDWFCMLDKVAVSGMGCLNNLNHLLLFTTSMGVVLNICDMLGCTMGGILRSSDHPIKQRGIAIHTLMYYVTVPVYFVCLMYALVGYNNLRHELCFHCRYGFFVIQTISVLLC